MMIKLIIKRDKTSQINLSQKYVWNETEIDDNVLWNCRFKI